MAADLLKQGDIEFFDNYIPSLDAGDYSISISQQLDIAPKPYGSSQNFTVRGPQVTLPAEDIYSLFPPSNSTGLFADNLAHVVLSKRVLPWERQLRGQPKTTPWMALLMFTEQELYGGGRDTKATTVEISSLNVAEAGIIKPVIKIESDIDQTGKCQVIRTSGRVLAGILPEMGELPYLSHVRQVNTDGQEDLGLDNSGFFSVTVGNRFPQASSSGIKNVVHLVTLEGMEDGMINLSTIDQSKTYQLVSLASWSFTCISDPGETFETLVENFVTAEAGLKENLLLKLPETAGLTGTEAQQRISKGYVPLAYKAITGESSFAWYRGPLVPEKTTRLTKPEPFLSASAAIIYDPLNGIFDHSLSTAWQAGRSVALSDKSFCNALSEFRKAAIKITDLMLERTGTGSDVTSEVLKASVAGKPSRTSFMEFLKNPAAADLLSLKNLSSLDALPKQDPGTTKQPHSQAVLGLFLTQPALKDAVQQLMQEQLNALGEWLADLYDLKKLSFMHLVPDVRLLPTESLRFFYADSNWTESVTDGALSIGIQSSRDTAFQKLMQGPIRAAVNKALQSRRAAIAGKDISIAGTDPCDLPVGGLLIRSALISGCPGLVIKAYQGTEMLKNIRMESMAPSVLLCLFLGIPDRVVISEPQHSLRFGVDTGGNADVRSLVDPVGQELHKKLLIRSPDPTKGTGLMRKDSSGTDTLVLNIKNAQGGLLSALLQELKPEVTSISPGSFAIQMVQAPEEITFS